MLVLYSREIVFCLVLIRQPGEGGREMKREILFCPNEVDGMREDHKEQSGRRKKEEGNKGIKEEHNELGRALKKEKRRMIFGYFY